MVQAPQFGAKGAEADVQVAQAEAPQFEKVHWLKEPHLRKLYAMAVVLMVASATTGYDGMLINTSQQIALWGEYFPEHANANKLGILINMFNIGSIISFFITPYVADRWGRKLAITVGCLFMVLGGCLSAFATSYGMFIGGRFLLGFGNSFAQMCSPLLLTEICHPQHRGPVTAIYNCLWNLGALVVSCIGWGTASINNEWSWRSITFIQIVPSVIQLAFIYWIPESPRYLLSKDRGEEALDMLAKFHAGGDRQNATVQYEFQEIRETMRIEAELETATSYVDFVKTRGNRWRLAIIISLGIISQYSGNALFSNYMNTIYEGAGITNQNQKLAISTGQTIFNLIITIGAALCIDKLGRRPLFLTSMGGMVLSFVCWTITGAVYENSNGTNKGDGYAQLVFIWLFGMFYDIGFSGLLVAYALEVLPFHLRAKGMMIMNITVQAILAIGNQTNVLAWDGFPKHWNFMLFYTLWDLCEFAFVYFVYVETKGPTLENIARIFDGDDAVAHIDLHQVEKEIHNGEHLEDIDDVTHVTPKSAV
ncbi:Lactose permease [Hyphodiscus hymeniophilus]|uniref:Lactose permease n=1 Tax=Hyphodiscus hymeniophilus TaxID=353542 RepID=A0A9P7AV27_9HELO|nr:Lactose permease [Hyphodiscus hymeniophilus]